MLIITGPAPSAVEDARQLGELAAGTDADQFAFELIAFMELANATSLLPDDAGAYERGRAAIRTRLDAVAT